MTDLYNCTASVCLTVLVSRSHMIMIINRPPHQAPPRPPRGSNVQLREGFNLITQFQRLHYYSSLSIYQEIFLYYLIMKINVVLECLV